MELCNLLKNYNVTIKTVDEKQYFFVINFQDQEVCSKCKIEEVYAAIYQYLREHQIQIFHERVFGGNEHYEEVKAVRMECLKHYFDEEAIPFTYVGAPVCKGHGLAGINIMGIRDSKYPLRTVEYEGKVCGREWENHDYSAIILNAVLNHEMGTDLVRNNFNVFKNANQILEHEQYKFTDVIRTWIYIPHILSQYDEFNVARNQFYKELDLVGETLGNEDIIEKIYMPASTGIGSLNPYSDSTLMDLYAIKKKDKSSILDIYVESGKVQKSAYRYGSAFSRSIVVEENKKKHIFLSGSASIDETGATVYIGDIKAQIKKVFEVIGALVAERGLSVADAVEGTVFLKRPEYYEVYKEYIEENNLKLSFIPCLADVCRDNLLFEIDAIFAQ